MTAKKTTQHKVVLVGRTNVGKSTLFNRLTESEQAIVSKIPGTTRDVNKGLVEWQGKAFTLVDTGGIDISVPNEIDEHIVRIAWREIMSADLVLFVSDAKTGFVPNDQAIIQKLHENKINFWIVPNKADSPKLRSQASEFYQHASEVWPLSAANGSGTGDLLDAIQKEFNDLSDYDAVKAKGGAEIRVAFAGMPNVGKSSLINAILKTPEVIVSEIPHTTRETRNLQWQFKGQDFSLIDTAGLRKPRKMREFLHAESAKRSLLVFKKADWVIFTIDASQPTWGEQDRYILNEILHSGANIIIAANKWDKLPGEKRFAEFKERWYRCFGHHLWIPFIPVSALTAWHVEKLLEQIMALNPNRYRTIPSSALDRLLKAALKRRPPQKKKGPEAPYIHTVKQLETAPPYFEVVIDIHDTLAESYVRFLEKMLRNKFDFTATPIRIFVRAIK